jgi:putative ABC transport system substrate-binding protein
MVTRRRTLAMLGAGALAAPFATVAQSPRVHRVGWVTLAMSGGPSPFLDAFRQGLKDRGYVEGRNIVIEIRYANASHERADATVAEFVRTGVDVIVAQGAAVYSAYRRGGTTPVVMGFSGDPVEAKFVDTLARPGGSRTGMSFLSLELVGKRLEVLAPLLPAGARVAVVADPAHPGEQSEFRASVRAAQDLGLTLGYFPARNTTELEAALARMASDGTQALVVFPDALTLDNRERLAAFGLRQRLPLVSGWSLFADSGFLMSYGPNLRDCYAHIAGFVDKILRGAKPGDLPIELPSSVEFVVNAKTARAIGVRLPPAMLVRAERVIE